MLSKAFRVSQVGNDGLWAVGILAFFCFPSIATWMGFGPRALGISRHSLSRMFNIAAKTPAIEMGRSEELGQPIKLVDKTTFILESAPLAGQCDKSKKPRYAPVFLMLPPNAPNEALHLSRSMKLLMKYTF